MKHIAGFNLIELMITLSIISILSLISLPIYFQHLIHANRLAAEMNLIKLSNALEKYFLLNNTYEKSTLKILNFSPTIVNNRYQLQIVKATASEYAIQATPLAQQAENDKRCGTLLLDSSGTKNITGTADVNTCWS